MLKQSVLFALVLFFGSTAHASGERPDRDVLTENLAKARKEIVGAVSYDLKFHFLKAAKGFEGTTAIDFTLLKTAENLSIDALLTTVKSVEINGRKISDFVMHTGSLEIPAGYLEPVNHLVIEYYNEFAEDGSGLAHFTDPVDGREYIYSDSEPYGAHKIFPCFDQPNLKAKYRISITAPKDWLAIANEFASDVRDLGDESTHRFVESKLFSTYLVFIAAGGFHEWKTDWQGLPVVLYARESLAKYVDAENIFSITKKGLNFYSDYFGYRYPFSKYGQIFCPDLGPGAMENPGSVSLNEKMIFRGPQAESAQLERSNTVLHEMAHMWFGDLVTMNWWSDLWLNESFATFMASLAQERALNLGERSWQSFNSSKGWAYWQDQLVTTHPIVTEVADTNVASTNFDGITYAKGASTLKQLHFYVGDENFRNGVRSYFQKFAWKNATHADFVNEIAAASAINLGPWSKGWLESAGLNHVKPALACSNGKIESLRLTQEPSASGLFLPHKTNIGFYRATANGLVKQATLIVNYEKADTDITAAKGMACPDLVEPNEGDEDYAIANLDGKSLLSVQQIARISSPLERQMLWGTLYQMVRNRTLKLSEYFSFLQKNLPLETNEDVLSYLVDRHSNVDSLYWGTLTVADRSALAPELENHALQGMKNSPPQSSVYLMWLDHYIAISDSIASRSQLINLLREPALDQTRRWSVIVKLGNLGAPEALPLAREEAARDATDGGRNSAFATAVAVPDLASKQTNWKLITDLSSSLTFAQRRAGAAQFRNADHPEISAEFVAPFYAMVKEFKWDGQMFMMHALFESLFPNLCTEEQLVQSTKTLEATRASLPVIAIRSWLEANDELGRCVAMRAYNRL